MVEQNGDIVQSQDGSTWINLNNDRFNLKDKDKICK